jgi:DNA-binding CsgD family transcriptional regulator
MSGLKPKPLIEFYRSLHARNVSTDTLARKLGVAGGTVRKMIGNLGGRRGYAWRALLAKLTPRERELLHHVEQCPTWNNRKARRNRPRWTPDKAARFSHAA